MTAEESAKGMPAPVVRCVERRAPEHGPNHRGRVWYSDSRSLEITFVLHRRGTRDVTARRGGGAQQAAAGPVFKPSKLKH